MDKSNVIDYAEKLAEEKHLSSKQKDELIEALKEATSVLGGDKKRVEEALTFLDNKIQNSYEQFFTPAGVNVSGIKATTMIKVNEITREKRQIKIDEKNAKQMQKIDDILDSYFEETINVELDKIDILDFPESEVIGSIKNSLSSYFDKEEFPEVFLDKLSKDIFNAKKRAAIIEKRVEAGENRADVESEIYPDKISELKDSALLEIDEETQEEKYYETVQKISKIASEKRISLEEAEKEYFEGKRPIEYAMFRKEKSKEKSRLKEYEKELKDEEVKKQNGGLKRRERKKFIKYQKYIEDDEKLLALLEARIEELKKEGNLEDCNFLEQQCADKRADITSYKKMISKMTEISKRREAKQKEDFEFYQTYKVKVEELKQKNSFTDEAAASRVFGLDIKSYYRYLHINDVLYNDEKEAQKEEKENKVGRKLKGLDKKEKKRYVENQGYLDNVDNKIIELERLLEESRESGNLNDVARLEKDLASKRKERVKYLREINKLEIRSNDVTGENVTLTGNGEQARENSQLVVEELQTGGEKKKFKPFESFKGLFKRERTTTEGIKGAYDTLVTAQTTLKTQEVYQAHQNQEELQISKKENQESKQSDKSTQDEPVL